MSFCRVAPKYESEEGRIQDPVLIPLSGSSENQESTEIDVLLLLLLLLLFGKKAMDRALAKGSRD